MKQTVIAVTPQLETGLKITLDLYNYAQIDSETLIRAKDETKRIYREIGIETLWIDKPIPEQPSLAPYRVSEIRVNIIPHASEGLGLLSNSLGIAPGTGPNRGRLYVVYDRVETLYRKQVASTARQKASRPATTAQILGYAIAHEIGHLLGLDAHAEMGIMRSAWLSNDLLDLAYDNLAFTAQQAAVIRNQVRIRQQGFEFNQTADYRDLRLDGLKQFQAGHFAEAQSLLETALDLATRSNDTYAVALIREAIGDVYHNEFELSKAEQAYMEAAIILRREPEHAHALAITLVNLGGVLSGQHRSIEGIKAFSEGYKLVKDKAIQDPQLEVQILNGMGVAHFQQGQSKKAKDAFARATNVRVPPGESMPLELTDVYNNLATVYAGDKNYSKAADFYARALQMKEQRLGASDPSLIIILDNLGDMHIRMQRYVEAESEFLRSFLILENHGLMESDLAFTTLHGLGRTRVAKGDLQWASALLAQAVQVGHSISLRNFEMVDLLDLYTGVLKSLSNATEAERVYSEAARMRAELAFTTRAREAK
jgi:tetratricopeptide (TPR) repeat protein